MLPNVAFDGFNASRPYHLAHSVGYLADYLKLYTEYLPLLHLDVKARDLILHTRGPHLTYLTPFTVPSLVCTAKLEHLRVGIT